MAIMTTPQTTARQIVAAFSEKKHTVLSLSKATGIPRSTLRRSIATGAFTAANLITLADTLNLPAATFLDHEAAEKLTALAVANVHCPPPCSAEPGESCGEENQDGLTIDGVPPHPARLAAMLALSAAVTKAVAS